MSDAPNTVRPRDAASLLIVRERRGQHQVLMGKRSSTDRFMPDVFVFPGGRVDPSDADVQVRTPLTRRQLERLGAALPERRARMLAVAAVRETFEETGLVIGEQRAGELRPHLEGLEYIARAITPAQSHIRYHARFFMTREEHITGKLRSNGELIEMNWLSFDQAREAASVDVTQMVLDEAQYRLAKRPFRGVPLICYRHGVIQLRYRESGE